MTKTQEVREALMSVMDEEHADAVIEHRRFTIKKPLTAYAAKILAKRLAEWGDANEAADMMIEKAWQGFNREWVRDRRPPHFHRQTPSDVFGAIANGTYRQ